MRDGNKNGVGFGMAYGCGLNALLLLLLLVLLYGVPRLTLVREFMGAFGLIQWIVLGPSIYFLRRAGETEMAKGVGIVGAVAFLVNGLCWLQ